MNEPEVALPAPGSDGAQEAQLLGALLVAQGAVSEEDVEAALNLQRAAGGRIGAVLMRMGAVQERSVLVALGMQLHLPIWSSETAQSCRFPEGNDAATCRRIFHASGGQALLLASPYGEGLACVTSDPLSAELREILERISDGTSIEVWLASGSMLEHLAGAYAADLGLSAADAGLGGIELAEDGPTIELVNTLISQGAELRASDIHLEPRGADYAIRFRIDGVLGLPQSLPASRSGPAVSRIKLLAGLDISERRLPQDGRIRTRLGGRDMDLRVSSIPSVEGESVVLRIMPGQSHASLSFVQLGYTEEQVVTFLRWLEAANGLVLVTGPTGSGKSTTLYTGLQAIDSTVRKIITVEDPVELRMRGIVQIQTHAEIGYDFARALRSVLRHDPDVVMVGEIRDRETAQIAIQASLTGHLVLSTLHTNDAVSSFTRLVDMGIEPFLVAAPMRGVIAQRLARRLCDGCRVPSQEAAASLPIDAVRYQRGPGCSRCKSSGYSGRLAVLEMLEMDDTLRHLVSTQARAEELAELLAAREFVSMREDGMHKVGLGMTDEAEVYRVTVG
jgi:general secretion pathway protein E